MQVLRSSDPGARATMVWMVLCCAIGAVHLALYNIPFDDAYISFRYARNVASGLGYVFNPGERVEGFTCFGWVSLLAGAAWLGLSLPVVAVALSAASGLAMPVLTSSLARRMAPDSCWWPLAPLLVVTNGSWAYYAMSGMETPLTCVLLLGAFLVLLPGTPEAPAGGSRGPLAGLPSGLLAGLLSAFATLMRPEGAGYLALTVAVLASSRQSRRQILPVIAAYAVVIVPFFIWRWRYFSWALPNTFYAKVAGGGGLAADGWQYLEQFLTLHGFWLVLPALVVLARRRGLAIDLRLAGAWLAGSAINVILVGGDAFAFFRFLLPILPVGAAALAGLVGALHARSQSLPGRSGGGIWAAGATAALLVAATTAAAFVPRVTLTGDAGPSHFRQVRSIAPIMRDHQMVGRWLGRTLPPDTRLAINPAGIIPYESGLPTIDMLGLTDVHIAHRALRLGRGARGHEKYDAGYVLARAPDIIVPGLPLLSAQPLGPQDLPRWFGRWMEFLPGDRDLFSHPRLAELYQGFNAAVAPGRFLPLLVHRRSFERLFGARL